MYFIGITLTFALTNFFVFPGRVSLGEYVCNVLLINSFIRIPYVDGAHWYLTTIISCICCCQLIRIINKEKRNTLYLVWSVLLSLIIFLKALESNEMIELILSALLKLLGGQYALWIMIGISISIFQINKNSYVAYAVQILSVIMTVLFMEDYCWVYVVIAESLFVLVLKGAFVFLDNKYLYAMGRGSYAIYITHQMIGYMLIYYTTNHVGGYSEWISFGVLIFMSFIGMIMHKYVEMPVNDYIRQKLILKLKRIN